MMARFRLTDDEVIERPFHAKQLWRLLGYLKPYRKQVLITFLLMVVMTLAGVFQPRIAAAVIADIQRMMHTASGKADLSYLSKIYFMMSAMLLSAVIVIVAFYYRLKLMESIGRKAISNLRADLFAHLQTLPLSYFDTRPAGKLLVRVINDVNSLNDLFVNGVVNVLVDFLTLILVLIVMLMTSVPLTLVALSTIPLMIFMAFSVRKKIRRGWQDVRRKSATVNAYLHESLAGMRVTQAFSQEDDNFTVFKELVGEHRKSWMYAIKINAIFFATLDVILNISAGLLYWVGVLMLKGNPGPTMIETLMTMVWFSGKFWEPINNISNTYNSILVAMASTERIFEIMDTPADIADAQDAKPIPAIRGDVQFDHVSFAYEAEKPVLLDVSFDIPAGTTVALVGPTGAGKSTIVSLISRFWDPQQGKVLVDGQDIRHVALHSLRSQMGIMLQESFIFTGSIRDNIRYGKLDATQAEIEAAAKTVFAHDFILQMEKGYDTEVNERGAQLSVGQKQLISFARTLIADPKILVLDEATSSIDTKTEFLIQQALSKLLHGRTSFVIAHRLSTIRKADLILVVAENGIIERGNHAELMQLEGGLYRGLVDAQYRFLTSEN